MRREAAETKLALDRVSARYGGAAVLSDLSLRVAGGELLALLGPSGCGKTTALKVVAGLLAPAGGDVRFDGESVLALPAERRGAVMVFQKPLLFPYLTVAENVGFGLKMRGLARGEAARRVAEALRLVQLEGYERRRPKELSGGQEQRVALARALVTEPRVLLLDEPFSALDETLRAEMRALVRALQRRLRITTLFVTHDQAEAASLADRVALLLDGKLEQVGPPRDFFTAPGTLRAARFFGWQVVADGAERLAFRPESARLVSADDPARAGAGHDLAGRVASAVDLGPRRRYRVALGSGALVEVEEAAAGELFGEGAPVRLLVPGEAARRFGPGAA